MAKIDTWRFMRAARAIQTETPTQKIILLLLASHAGSDGSCWPSYKCLMRESGFTGKATITHALQYLRDTLKIVTWRKGWGNAHRKGVSNVYKFDFQAMSKRVDESSPDDDESSSDHMMKVHLTTMKVHLAEPLRASSEVPANQEEPAVKEPASPLSSLSSLQPSFQSGRKGEPTSLEESSPDELSSLRAKLDHYRAHGGASPEEFTRLRTQITFMEGRLAK